MFDQSIDRPTFLLHWRITYTLLAIGSLVALIGDVAMVFLRRWSWLLLTAVATAAIAFNIVGRLTGYTLYGFEGGSLKELLVLVLFAVATGVGYRQWPKTPINDTDA